MLPKKEKLSQGFTKHVHLNQNTGLWLSFAATSVMQLMFSLSDVIKNISVEAVLETLGIHWYRPSKITRGLMQAYVQCQTLKHLFSSSKVMSNYTTEK